MDTFLTWKKLYIKYIRILYILCTCIQAYTVHIYIKSASAACEKRWISTSCAIT